MQSRKSTNVQGIDVSHHQGVINWAKVAADGIDFAFIKATQISIDRMFLKNVSAAKAAGILVGSYHYLDKSVTTVTLAKSAANDYYAAIKEAGGVKVFDLPPVLDYEIINGISTAQVNLIAQTFLAEIKRLTGITPLLYTGNSFAEQFGLEIGGYPLWIARYGTAVPWDVKAWKEWTIWQYSDGSTGGTRSSGSRSVAGISGPVDLNEYNGTLAELKAAYKVAGGGGVPVTERDINVVSAWAADNWAEAKANGYFDGTRPGADITREETAIVINRLRNNFLKLIAGNTTQIADLEKRLQAIEKEGK
ncbi:glycoside hydrolase family 25 protein [Paenibacillus antarcticus]|uniref:Lysozyme n=1 Tax=Paenibacillus antarcticus TaxID=253703 RepID=A0A168MXM1_9BACL|nr:glycoside hydrolase family 25 protein [Paenibacillus antarcticus]OAB45163.1 hypothetical protein PBAT_14590 [Paenibacillus antarcticus]